MGNSRCFIPLGALGEGERVTVGFGEGGSRDWFGVIVMDGRLTEGGLSIGLIDTVHSFTL